MAPEETQGAAPCQVRRFLVVALRGRVVVEGVLDAVIIVIGRGSVGGAQGLDPGEECACDALVVAGTDMMGKVVIMGALSLYLDFINMFQFQLSFMGSRE